MAAKKRSTARKQARPARASEREGFKLDVKSAALRDLMTEQSKMPFGYATYYSGTQAELTKAGIPEYLFPRHDRRVAFRVNEQDAFIQRKGSAHELTLHWDHNGPRHYGASHPALAEIARMVWISIYYWLEIGPLDKTNEVPTQKLINCERAEDYRLPPSKRFKFSNGFRESLFGLTSELHREILNAEIMPLEPPKVPYEDSGDENIVSLDQARDTLQRISKRIAPNTGA